MRKNIAKNIAITVGILGATVIITELLYDFTIMDDNLTLLYILGVLLIAMLTSSYVYGIMAAILGSFLCDLFITEPRFGFSSSVGFPITLIVMLIVSIIMVTVTSRMKEQADIAHAKEMRSNLMYNINKHLLGAQDTDSITNIAIKYASMQLKCPVVFYTEDPSILTSGKFSEKSTPMETSEERKRAAVVFFEGSDKDSICDRDGGMYYQRIRSKDVTMGLLGVYYHNNHLTDNDKSFIRDIMGQIALAMELRLISDLKHKMEIETEKEKTKSILLRAVSHDLRTPLTGILGQSALISDRAESLTREDIKQYAGDIMDNSEWLIRMVENLLTVTRISDSNMEVKKTEEIIEEIMAQATSIVRKRFKTCNISVEAPEDPVTMWMDAILITQVLINIMENAIKYSSERSPVHLKMEQKNNNIHFIVTDVGEGVPQRLLTDINRGMPEKSYVDSKKGLGLGLLICKTIIDAHNGKLIAENRPEKGSVFTIILPKEK